MLRGGGGAAGLTNAANVSITGGTITGVSGVPYLLAKAGIPIIVLATGTMGNNGALTVGTALGAIYASAYVVVPAGAIAAGVPAGTDIYYATFSSTTAGTIFNNLLSANLDSLGNPTIPASPTAFATTGPGAYAGVTATTTLITLSVPAGVMGTTGELYGDVGFSSTANANTKTGVVVFGGTNIFSNSGSFSSSGSTTFDVKATNRGSASVQELQGQGRGLNVVVTSNSVAAVNTANAVNLVLQLGHTTVTDNAVLERYAFFILK